MPRPSFSQRPLSPVTAEEAHGLRRLTHQMRRRIVQIVYDSGSGHIGAALSQVDLLVALYERYLRVDAQDPGRLDRDRFVLSKGHGGLGLVPILAHRGFIESEDIATFGETGSALGMHLDHRRVPGVEASTGSLGHGLGVALGMALGARMQGVDNHTYCLLSDGECYEGSTWEAAIAAPALKIGALTAIVDRNHLTMDGFTEQEVPLEPLADKWRAFGWRVFCCDGHDFDAICGAFDAALGDRGDLPAVIIASTIKGKGVSFMEQQAKWHYGALDSKLYAAALAALDDVAEG